MADAEEGRWLLAAMRSAAHVHLGFGSFAEYVGRLFGYGHRTVEEKLRVAEALEELPATANALETGALSWSAARELTRVAVGETEREWLEVLGGPSDEGRSSYQVSLVVCSECGHGAQLANGDVVKVGPEVVELAQCDGQAVGPSAAPTNDNAADAFAIAESKPAGAHVGATKPPGISRAKQTIPPAVRRAVLARDQQVSFRHADGSRYGAASRPHELDVFGKVLAALRNLGFRDALARTAVSEIVARGDVRSFTAETLLRAALVRLTPACIEP